jgi:CRISPR system Cascade subunit CasC
MIEVHILQSFGPSSLNHGEHGAIKDAIYGGRRRARISSQSIKRSMRGIFEKHFPNDYARRSRYIPNVLVEKITENGKSRKFRQDEAFLKVTLVLAAAGFVTLKEGRTEYQLYLGNSEMNDLVKLIKDNWKSINVPNDWSSAIKSKSGKDLKALAPKYIEKAISSQIEEILKNGLNPEVLLFGRNLADIPTTNSHATLQVGHAISTHQIAEEFDFFSAVDDNLPEGEMGSSILEETEFTAACFYKYANLDNKRLLERFGNDKATTRKTIEVFLEAFALCQPKSMQTAFAHPTEIGFAAVFVHDMLPLNMVNAFLEPVPTSRGNLMDSCIQRFEQHCEKVDGIYGKYRQYEAHCVSQSPLKYFANQQVSNLEKLFEATLKIVRAS